MSERDIIQAPDVTLSTPVQSKWQREHLAFLRLRPELLEKYRGQYVAIHEEKVVDSDPDEIALARRMYQRFGPVPVHAEFISDQLAQPVRIPTPRVVQG